MSINTKLVLLLTLAVGAVMLVGSILSLREREAALETALRDELRAHAVTLQIALEENYQNGRVVEAQRLIDRLRENSHVYGVLIFDENANLLALSQPLTAADLRQPPELATVLQTGAAVEVVRTIKNRKFLTVILPVRFDAQKSGALEIVKPLALIEDDIAGARLNQLATTLLLLATIFLVVYVVLRRSLLRPVRDLLEAAQALGRGRFDYRVKDSGTGDELARLATEFNRMADNLAEQRRAADAEAENRLNLEKQLRHGERLATVGRLAAGIAHELGAPLNVIDARAEQILNKPDSPPEKLERNLQIIRSQAARITRIIRQLLNMARPFNLDFAPVPLEDLIKSALESFENQSEKGQIEIDFSPTCDFTISADRDFMTQVLTNIFQNAVQEMNGAGVLRVACETAENDFVALKISDTGGGIAPENLDKIFDPFFTTKDIG
ncbi:MAG: HAMP domain-containing protein [Pyrinomonadaceae bacterium]|nr:HAMP domain-containing protein [Pyrinomonadaceae bacterium]